MRNNLDVLLVRESGFTVVEGIIVVCVVALIIAIGGTGFDTYQHRTTHPLPTGPIAHIADPKSYTYAAKYFSLKYPDNWAEYGQDRGPIGSLSPLFAPTPLSNSLGFGVSVSVDKSEVTSAIVHSLGEYESVRGNIAAPKVQPLTINGYKTTFLQYKYITRSGTATFPFPSGVAIDDYYIVTHGNLTVEFSFMVKGIIIWNAIPSEHNFSSRLPDENSIVTSIQFLN